MYAVTHRLDPETYHALARAVFAEMLLAGYTAVGEFHYVHHAAGGRRYDDPNVMGKALISAAREVGIRITLLDTCYLAGGLTGRRPPAARRGAAAVLRRRRSRPGPSGSPRLADDDDRADRCRRALGARRAVRRPGGGGRRRGPRRPAAARAPVGAAGREPRLRGVLRLLADRAARRGGAAHGADHCGARNPPVRQRHRAARRGPGRRRASARPPSATSPTASARPAGCTTPGRGSRSGPTSTPSSTRSRRCAALEMHERLESLERGRFAGADLLGMAALQRLPRPRAGTTAGVIAERSPGRPRGRAARQPTHGRLRAPVACSTRRPRPTSPTSSSPASTSCATAGTGRATSGRMLTDAIAAVRK